MTPTTAAEFGRHLNYGAMLACVTGITGRLMRYDAFADSAALLQYALNFGGLSLLLYSMIRTRVIIKRHASQLTAILGADGDWNAKSEQIEELNRRTEKEL